MKLYHLTTDSRRENILVGNRKPVFGWRAETEETNVYQKSYRIQVRNEEGDQIWDSGIVVSSRMVNIPYEGEELQSGMRLNWQVSCVFGCDHGSREAEAESYFETAYFHKEDWKGIFIGETKDHEYHLYRKKFLSSGKVKRAKLFICGMGSFECYLNGKRISDYVLEPGWTDYRKTCLYTAYDVTEYLADGENTLLVKLGDGMYNLPGGRYVYYERSFGKAALLCQLELFYEEGHKEYIVTDESWKMAKSPVDFCCMYGGEDFDGRRWTKEYVSSDDEKIWLPALQTEPPKGVLKPAPMEPLKVKEIYEPVNVREVEPGIWQYDFGRNFSGWARIFLETDGKMEGRRVVLSAAEKLGADGRIDQSVTGEGYAWTYILNGEKEQEFAPDFTYTGFRYLEMKGAVPAEKNPCMDVRELPELVKIQGEFIYPDLEQAGDFVCSNSLFNEIHQIVLQAIKSNTKSYFTDCPHRERLGWLEQTHLIGPSIMYNLDVHNLYRKIEGDMADSQRENGLVPDICPEYVTGFEKWHTGFVDSPEWGSACILAPWYAYKRYGDLSLLEEYYPVMKRYVDYLSSRTHHEILHHGLGDWLDIGPCTPHSQNTPVAVSATCIYYYDLQVMKKIAALLGEEEAEKDFQNRMECVFREYNLQFLDDQTGRYANGSQAAQAMSLITGLVPPEYEEKAVKELKDDIVKRGYAITAGDVGHPFLIAALMKYGMSDILNRMTNITDKPGYGYQVACGATALTEEWDGPMPGNIHGSQNHLMLGSIEEWFYGSLGGMELIRDGLPFDKIRIVPYPAEGVDWVNAWTMHPYGKIGVKWKKEGKKMNVQCQIPPGVTAYLGMPDGTTKMIMGSGNYSYEWEIASGGQEK